MVMAPPPACDSAVFHCFHDCLVFPPPAFPSMISSLTSPQSVSPQSAAALTLGLLHNSLNSSFQTLSLPGDQRSCPGYIYGCSKDCLILIPFRLPQISCFSSDSDDCLDVGIRPLLQFPQSPRVGPVLLALMFFPLVPSIYQVLRGCVYIFFSTGQVLLCILSWWSACTSVSEGVFLMYPWREMSSTSTYFSATLF